MVSEMFLVSLWFVCIYFPSSFLSEPSKYILIQMLCEERGLFLEMADIIRGFGLNILKGVMEVRQSKVWSRFIVEVCYIC